MAEPIQTPLRILHLEDSPADAELIKSILPASGIDCIVTCVKSRGEFKTALEQHTYDLIISDYKLPGFDGLSALEMAREKAPDCPFIFVSGALGEEAAIESLKRGATDYLLKDRLGRLGAAVRRALREAAESAEKKVLEAQLLRAQRMETIGALAGGVAHDLNNALVPIVIGAQLLKEGFHDEAERAKFLDLITKSAQRCTQMVRQILTFAKGSKGKVGSVHLPSLITEVAKIVDDTFPKSIVIRTRTSEDVWGVEGDPTELHQVLMNLCVNARDAMPQGGQLTLTAQNVQSPAEVLPPEDATARSGPFVLLTVVDTGTGIAPEILPRILDPFFTTKSADKGTGLGLSTVANIVKRHGGVLRIHSELGKGTEFRILLPVSENAVVAETRHMPGALPVGRGELILIVDDEQVVVELARTTLENYGYRVITAPNGLEAIACFERHKNEIRLILTDTDMPFLDGMKAIRAIHDINPNVPVIIASGTTQESAHVERIDGRHVTTLSKPYQVAGLLEGVARALKLTTT
jgi:two-component system, cell cycle sensor histidine kinase and response regulator CckA